MATVAHFLIIYVVPISKRFLCVLSSQGKHFQAVGKMLGFKEWFKWAPSANQLAYISGEGRFFVENKKMVVAEIPASKQQ